MSVTRSNIALEIHEYLVEEVIEDDYELDYEDNLLTEVGVDSMGMLRLVGFIESQFELKVSPAYFTIDNFKNVTAVSVFVETLIQEQN
ncbi:MAG: acyl carrier protein [Alphaproteobacteria bacterium]|jgi:acyl carrier protein